jgi:hypothetical protein
MLFRCILLLLSKELKLQLNIFKVKIMMKIEANK